MACLFQTIISAGKCRVLTNLFRVRCVNLTASVNTYRQGCCRHRLLPTARSRQLTGVTCRLLSIGSDASSCLLPPYSNKGNTLGRRAVVFRKSEVSALLLQLLNRRRNALVGVQWHDGNELLGFDARWR